MKIIEKYGIIIVIILLLLNLFNGCGISSRISKLSGKVDKIDTTVVTKDQLKTIIETTPNWKTLEIEELSDKDHVSINHYKNEAKK